MISSRVPSGVRSFLIRVVPMMFAKVLPSVVDQVVKSGLREISNRPPYSKRLIRRFFSAAREGLPPPTAGYP